MNKGFKSEELNMTREEKLELYFFKPVKTEESYCKAFRRVTGLNIVAYSPLYLLRRQILVVSGKTNGLKKTVAQIPYLSAIILSNIAITGLAELINTEDEVNYKDFYSKHLGKNSIQLLGLRLLRNSLEHNNFQLFTRIYKNNTNHTKWAFDEMVEYLSEKIEWNGIWRPNKSQVDFVKVTYALGKNSNNIVSEPSIQNYLPDEGYLLVQFRIDPSRFLDRLEEAVVQIENEIKGSEALSVQFDSMVTADNWMKVFRG